MCSYVCICACGGQKSTSSTSSMMPHLSLPLILKLINWVRLTGEQALGILLSLPPRTGIVVVRAVSGFPQGGWDVNSGPYVYISALSYNSMCLTRLAPVLPFYNPTPLLLLLFEILSVSHGLGRPHTVAKKRRELLILLLLPPKCWGCRHELRTQLLIPPSMSLSCIDKILESFFSSSSSSSSFMSTIHHDDIYSFYHRNVLKNPVLFFFSEANPNSNRCLLCCY